MSHPLLEAWRRTLRRRGEAPAVTEAASGRVVSFRELDARARAWLDLHGGTTEALRGRAVVFASPNGAAWFEVFLGLMHAGAVAVPLDAAEPDAAQHALAMELRAGFRWDGARLVVLPPGARRFEPHRPSPPPRPGRPGRAAPRPGSRQARCGPDVQAG